MTEPRWIGECSRPNSKEDGWRGTGQRQWEMGDEDFMITMTLGFCDLDGDAENRMAGRRHHISPARERESPSNARRLYGI